MEWGLAQGLSADMQFDKRINDLRYRDEQMRRATAESEAKASLFADDLNYQNASNQYDNPIIKSAAKNQIQKIGEFVRNNPDYKTNVDKLSQLNLMKRELKDNPDLIRGVASDGSYNAYKKDLQEVAKNPQQHDTDAYNAVNEQWNNYLKYGNQGGAEAAKLEGAKAFVYTKPKDFIDLNKAFEDIGNGFKDMRIKDIKGKGLGAYEEVADPDSLKLVANQMYSQNKNQIDKEAAKKGMDPIAYVAQGINAHIPKKRDFGDYGLQKEIAFHAYKQRSAGTAAPEGNTYKTEIVDKDNSVVPVDLINELTGDGAKTILQSNNGKQVLDLTGINVKRTGYNFYPNKKSMPNVKYADGVAYISLDKAKELGIVTDPEKGFDFWMGGDNEVKSDWSKFATIETTTDADGKEKKAVKLTVFNPFDVNNAANAGVFNRKTMTSKQVPLPEQQYQNQQAIPAGTKQDWINNGWNEDQINEAVKQGKIKVK